MKVNTMVMTVQVITFSCAGFTMAQQPHGEMFSFYIKKGAYSHLS